MAIKPQDESRRAAYTALLQCLGQTNSEQVQAVLEEREQVEPESDLSAEVVERLKQKIQISKQ
jgi:hypothetical protein